MFTVAPITSNETYKKALPLLEDQDKGPFYDVIPDFAIFIKKKRDLTKFKERER